MDWRPPEFVILAGVIIVLLCCVAVLQRGILLPTWNDDARDLLKKGIKQEDYGHALEILLRKEVGDVLNPSSKPIPKWFVVMTITIVIIAAFMCVTATTAFGIGRGRASVQWQQQYGAFLRICLPTFLLGGVLASFLATFLYDYLNSP